eukprot:350687-Chlamydomonas_euryale.AAC.1
MPFSSPSLTGARAHSPWRLREGGCTDKWYSRSSKKALGRVQPGSCHCDYAVRAAAETGKRPDVPAALGGPGVATRSCEPTQAQVGACAPPMGRAVTITTTGGGGGGPAEAPQPPTTCVRVLTQARATGLMIARDRGKGRGWKHQKRLHFEWGSCPRAGAQLSYPAG